MRKSFVKMAKVSFIVLAAFMFVTVAVPARAQLTPCIELFGNPAFFPNLGQLAARLFAVGFPLGTSVNIQIDPAGILPDINNPDLCGPGVPANVLWIAPRTPQGNPLLDFFDGYLGAFYGPQIDPVSQLPFFTVLETLEGGNLNGGQLEFAVIIEEPNVAREIEAFPDFFAGPFERFGVRVLRDTPPVPFRVFANLRSIDHPLANGFAFPDLPSNLDTVPSVDPAGLNSIGTDWSIVATDRFSPSNASILGGIYNPQPDVTGLVGSRIMFTTGDFSGRYPRFPNGSNRYLFRVINWLAQGVPVMSARINAGDGAQICSANVPLQCIDTTNILFRRTQGGAFANNIDLEVAVFFTVTGAGNFDPNGLTGDWTLLGATQVAGNLFVTDPGNGILDLDSDSGLVSLTVTDPLLGDRPRIRRVVVSVFPDVAFYVPSRSNKLFLRFVQNFP